MEKLFKCKVQNCEENHKKHYCKICKAQDSDHLSKNCPVNIQKCKAKFCNENHKLHFCKICNDQDADHLSKNCSKLKENQPLKTIQEKISKKEEQSLVLLKCKATTCKQNHKSHYCKICKQQDSDHQSKYCSQLKNTSINNQDKNELSKKILKCKSNDCQENHLKHFCKKCGNQDSDHRSKNCSRPKFKCQAKGCKENHYEHYCNYCGDKNSDHKSKNCKEHESLLNKKISQMDKIIKNLKISEVFIIRNMISPIIKQQLGHLGFRDLTKQYNSNEQGYKQMHGFEIIIDQGLIIPILQVVSQHEYSYITDQDIDFIFQNQISEALFSLEMQEELERYNPFQTIMFYPQCLEGSSYLQQLFHADYILKQFACGAEIQYQWPYDSRKIKNLLKTIPYEIKKYFLKPLKLTETHRFWIEHMPVQYDFFQENNKMRFILKQPQMIVKKQQMEFVNGKLYNAEKDSSDDGPEAQFCTKFTEQYNDLAEYFPELKKLQLMTQISAIIGIIQEFQQKNYFQVKQYQINNLSKSINIKNQLPVNKNQIKMHMITGCSFIPTVFNLKNVSWIYGGVKILRNYQKGIPNFNKCKFDLNRNFLDFKCLYVLNSDVKTSKQFQLDRKQLINFQLIKFDKFSQNQQKNIDLIIDCCHQNNIYNKKQMAYVLATAYHESKILPVEEAGGKNKIYGKEGYYGRGYVQLTHLQNYDKFGKILGVDLVNKPELALQSENAAKILVIGMRDGLFVNNHANHNQKLSNFLNEIDDLSIKARTIVNGNDRAELIEGYYNEFLEYLKYVEEN